MIYYRPIIVQCYKTSLKVHWKWQPRSKPCRLVERVFDWSHLLNNRLNGWIHFGGRTFRSDVIIQNQNQVFFWLLLSVCLACQRNDPWKELTFLNTQQNVKRTLNAWIEHHTFTYVFLHTLHMRFEKHAFNAWYEKHAFYHPLKSLWLIESVTCVWQMIYLSRGFCCKNPSEALAETGWYNRPPETEINLWGQTTGNRFFSRPIVKSLELTHRKWVPDRQYQTEKSSTRLPVRFPCPVYRIHITTHALK